MSNVFKAWSVLSLILVVLLAVHGLIGADMLFGLGYIPAKPLAYLFAAFVVIHALFGILFSIGAVKTGIKTGHWYLKRNAGFWVKRVSGLVILAMLLLHFTAFTTTNPDGSFALVEFSLGNFSCQMVFLIALFTHVFVSVKPGLVRAGVTSFKPLTVIGLIALVVLLFAMAASFVAYYLSWTGGAL